MNEFFDLPVVYNGKELLFPTRFLQLGYTYKFAVNVHGTSILFEPDEEGLFRAVATQNGIPKNVDTGLLQAIAEGVANVQR
ncbi:hypothetical protein [Flavisolibacter ginsenosidimutans]|uniref:Uncharacterized protein n=1 Tax=Flavisolibacter ginsenosidimutans TaxID=661481 RepID=A0A5B8UJ43_9BACT|nr:hypothetical protein [Flavisolibacter ginsenosidimutans]QEC56721.1 hypothetical protein FSB75_12705 [Flavisolibacter ginsenosidimutans]